MRGERLLLYAVICSGKDQRKTYGGEQENFDILRLYTPSKLRTGFLLSRLVPVVASRRLTARHPVQYCNAVLGDAVIGTETLKSRFEQ